jgi:hypothetical protein
VRRPRADVVHGIDIPVHPGASRSHRREEPRVEAASLE